jgi:hypothetical protein
LRWAWLQSCGLGDPADTKASCVGKLACSIADVSWLRFHFRKCKPALLKFSAMLKIIRQLRTNTACFVICISSAACHRGVFAFLQYISRTLGEKCETFLQGYFSKECALQPRFAFAPAVAPAVRECIDAHHSDRFSFVSRLSRSSQRMQLCMQVFITAVITRSYTHWPGWVKPFHCTMPNLFATPMFDFINVLHFAVEVICIH